MLRKRKDEKNPVMSPGIEGKLWFEYTLYDNMRNNISWKPQKWSRAHRETAWQGLGGAFPFAWPLAAPTSVAGLREGWAHRMGFGAGFLSAHGRGQAPAEEETIRYQMERGKRAYL